MQLDSEPKGLQCEMQGKTKWNVVTSPFIKVKQARIRSVILAVIIILNKQQEQKQGKSLDPPRGFFTS